MPVPESVALIMPLSTPCPCGSGASLVACCGRWHAGEAAPTAEALMRSRYSAYVLGLEDYLLATWHASTRPLVQRLDPYMQWRRLDIVDTVCGVVEYIALGGDPGHFG